jgi:hypothetical protein
LLFGACSGRTDTFAETGHVDRAGADASVRDRSLPDATFTDALLSTDANEEVDRWERYCNVPNPGPCCCEPFEVELKAQGVPDAASLSCDFTITPPGRYRFKKQLINLDARMPDGGREGIVQEPSCAAKADAWMLVSEDPPVVRLCPETCNRLNTGDYETILVMQGCYTIYCP